MEDRVDDMSSATSSAINTAVDTLDGNALTGDAFNSAFDQVKELGDTQAIQFIQNTVIDTVAKATHILMNFRGFSFESSCWTHAPNAWFHGDQLRVNFGKLYCRVTLVSRSITLFNTDWPERHVQLPNMLAYLGANVMNLANQDLNVIQKMIDMSHALLHSDHCNRDDVFDCMARRVATSVMRFEPPLNWLPENVKRTVKSIAGHTQEAIDRLFQMIHVLLNTAGCERSNTFDCMAKLVANSVQRFAPPMNWLPQQLHTVVNAGQEGVDRVFQMIRDLLNTAGCDRANTFDCMAKLVANSVQRFAPPMNFLPQQLHTVVNAGQEGVDRLFQMISDLLNTPDCVRSNVFQCMAKRVASYVMQFEPPLNSMPSPVGVLAGSNVNSVRSLMAMGDDLMHCQNFESGHEVMRCLGFKIIERVPPLSYLNQLGDVIGEHLETFAKVATSMAMKALRGGTSLIQKASVSQFPAIGNMPVRHQQGNLVVEVHSQKMHPSLLQVVPMPKFELGGDVHVANLITQFHGREADSGSCLAFAPRTKNGAHVGNHQEATKDDWTSAKKEDFVQLEPWAVPCDNTWMKERDSGDSGLHCMAARQIPLLSAVATVSAEFWQFSGVFELSEPECVRIREWAPCAPGELEQVAGLLLLHGRAGHREVFDSEVRPEHPACSVRHLGLDFRASAERTLRGDHHGVLAEPDAWWPRLVRPSLGDQNCRPPALQPDPKACEAFRRSYRLLQEEPGHRISDLEILAWHRQRGEQDCD